MSGLAARASVGREALRGESRRSGLGLSLWLSFLGEPERPKMLHFASESPRAIVAFRRGERGTLVLMMRAAPFVKSKLKSLAYFSKFASTNSGGSEEGGTRR
jgi:hypothetical protein